MSMGTHNRRKLKAVIEIAKKNKWDVVLLSEIRADSCGVLYLGQDEDLIALIHSERAGIMLRGHLVSNWLDQQENKLKLGWTDKFW